MPEQPMKILQINTEKTWRGGERQSLLTMKGLLHQGLQPRLLCLENYPLARKAAGQSIPVALVKNQKQALRYLIKHGSSFDLIHAQTGKAQSLAVIARAFHRRKIIYTRRVDFKPQGLAAKFKYRLTDRTIAISPAIKNILESFPAPGSVAVIPSCIDTSRETLTPSAKALDLQNKYPGRKIVGTIAAMVPHKDPLTMVRTIRELNRLSPEKFIFVHFGHGEMENMVKSEVKRLELEDTYLFMGFEDNVESFYPVLDIFVMSSQEEGLGSSVLEAFRYKVPVVSTSAGGLEELVSGRGLTCPVHDYKCLAAGIGELLAAPEKFRGMVQNAYEYVLNHHSLERMTQDYIRVYQDLL
ncbi:MAG: glycosyltransferase family 4 protein [Desulfonatronovibrio sp.]